MNFQLSKKILTLLVIANILFLNSYVFAEWPETPLPVEITTSKEDTEYLRGILKDTFRSIYYFRNPATGLWTDFPEKPDPNELIKTECLLLAFTSIAIAGKIGLIPEGQAAREIDKMLTWIEKMPRTHGFFWGLIHPIDATSASHDNEHAFIFGISDYGWCYASLATVGEAYPQFKKRTDKLLKEVEWSRIYNKDTGFVEAIIKFSTDNTFTTSANLRELTGDCRTGLFMSVASGQVPPEVWAAMERHYVKPRYGLKYYKPGEAMGYGEQPWSMGYYLDERSAEFGMSNANLTWGQILYAKDMEFPSWGWSSCQDMDGYLGWGNHKTRSWSRINTHAVAAAVSMYPNQVVKAFRAMEKLGLKKPLNVQSGKKMDFGFRDSIDVDTYETPETLLPLDQSIVFLSLANYLYDGVVWKYFMKNEMVQYGISVIEDYRNPKKEYLQVYKNRDLAGPSPPPKNMPHPEELIVDDFSGGLNLLGGKRLERASSLTIQNKTGIIKFNFPKDTLSDIREELNGVDLTDYNALKLVIRSEKPGKVMVTMHLGGEGGYMPAAIGPKWKEIIIPFRCFLMGKEKIQFGNPDMPMRWTAMWHDRSRAEKLGIGPDMLKEVDIKQISFLSLPKEKIHSIALELRKKPETVLSENGVLDSMENRNAWELVKDETGSRALFITGKGAKGNALGCSFSISKNGGWIYMYRGVNLKFNKDSVIVFNLKGSGGPANLEVKVVDSSGATFLKILKGAVKDSGWNETKIKYKDFAYGWGGEKTDYPGNISQIHFAVTAPKSTDGKRTFGKVYFDELKIVN